MYRSRKKPMRTYGRKKSRVRYIKTNISVQNNTYLIFNCNISAESNANPPKQECNLFDSSSERKFDLLVGKKPTNIFSSSNSSLSTSEQLSGLKCSSLITSLGSIHENLPLPSTSQTSSITSWGSIHENRPLPSTSQTSSITSLGSIHENLPLPSTSQTIEMERRVAKLSPRNDAETILENVQFKVTKHLCLTIPSKARKSRISKRFSIGRARDIGNSTPIEKSIKELENPCIEEWGLSPIVGEVESNSLNSSNSPDIFETFDSDNEEQSQVSNHVVPKSSRLKRRNKKSIKLHSVILDRNRRKSTFLPAVKKREKDEVTENYSVLSCQDTPKDLPLPIVNESSSSTSENDSIIFIVSSENDYLDQQANNDRDMSINELPRKFSQLEIGALPDKCDSDNCSQEEDKEHEHKISSDKSEEEPENENDGSMNFDDTLNSGNRTLTSDNDELDEEDCDEEEEEEEDEEDDEKEDDDDFNEKEDDWDIEVEENDATLTKNTMLDDSKFKTTNVLDADNSFMLTGFELENKRTSCFIPGKKYRRSIAAFRHSKSTTGNLSRVGCNRYSIIRPSAKLEESKRMTLITTTLEECPDETASFINVDEDKNAAKQQVLRLCNQSDILSFVSVLSESPSNKVKKIGEGVYGEVFMITHPGKKGESIVIKIIPVEGEIVYNDEIQKKFHEIISEIYISQALSNLKKDDIEKAEFWTDVYCNIIASNCFKGRYPPFLLELWNIYDKQNRSENDSPKIFPEDQLYISLKMSHGGEDLQHHKFASARQSYHIIMQVLFALAVAERSLHFEHRDLHIGNILISKTKEKDVSFKIDGQKYKLPTFWRKATIIDYTLSRINTENHLFYNDLEKDEELFLGEGDIQFQVYRDMREDLMNEWQTFEPKTNIRWMHYLATKCFRDVEYANTSASIHKEYIKKLIVLADEILVFNSCHEYILNSDLFLC